MCLSLSTPCPVPPARCSLQTCVPQALHTTARCQSTGGSSVTECLYPASPTQPSRTRTPLSAERSLTCLCLSIHFHLSGPLALLGPALPFLGQECRALGFLRREGRERYGMPTHQSPNKEISEARAAPSAQNPDSHHSWPAAQFGCPSRNPQAGNLALQGWALVDEVVGAQTKHRGLVRYRLPWEGNHESLGWQESSLGDWLARQGQGEKEYR